MSWYNYLVIIIPTCAIIWVAFYCRRYIRDMVDFLSAGRVARRYVIGMTKMGQVAGVVWLIARMEQNYKCGFALAFWSAVSVAVGTVIGLTGYFTYRFRETRAMTQGQFLEMRYNRFFRVFATCLRTVGEFLMVIIAPSIAARFFVCYLGLPHSFEVFGVSIGTFPIVMIIILVISLVIIWVGGAIAILVGNSIQGLLIFPIMFIFIIFVMIKFPWSTVVAPTIVNRVAGQSFVNSVDISSLRDFNLFALFIVVVEKVLITGSWASSGDSTVAISPHEQKMASLLDPLRAGFMALAGVLLAVALIVTMNNANFSTEARNIRQQLSYRAAEEAVPDPQVRAELIAQISTLPKYDNYDAPSSHQQNPDIPYLNTARKVLDANGHGGKQVQEFTTLFSQLRLAIGIKNILPEYLIGLFGLLVILLMITTDSSSIFNISTIMAQDLILPYRKKPLPIEKQLWLIRFIAIFVTIGLFIGAMLLSQLDYINLFVAMAASIWIGGIGPVMIFGVYSRFGNTVGAFSALITGIVLSLSGILAQQYWSEAIYPWLVAQGQVEQVGEFLNIVSSPFHPWIMWKMTPYKFPINSFEIMFLTIMGGYTAYIVGSLIGYKKPFNLERMLHRGIYDTENKGEISFKERFKLRNIFAKLVGITPQYTRGDKTLAWLVFAYSIGFRFLLLFVLVLVWNAVSPWSVDWWEGYFYYFRVIGQGIIGAVTVVWFIYRSIIDLRLLFVALAERKADYTDNGRVKKTID